MKFSRCVKSATNQTEQQHLVSTFTLIHRDGGQQGARPCCEVTAPIRFTSFTCDSRSVQSVCLLTLPRRVLVVFYQPGQAKVGDLAHQVVCDEDVGGAQVPVDVVHPLDESHTVSDLQTERLTASRDGRFVE